MTLSAIELLLIESAGFQLEPRKSTENTTMNIKRLALEIALIATAGFANAGESTGTVTYVLVHEPNTLIFQAGNITNKPACNTQKQWAISMNDPMGKPILAVVLAAQAQGKRLWTLGYSNSCRDWPDRELPSFVQIMD